jgi:hypothetical protein
MGIDQARRFLPALPFMGVRDHLIGSKHLTAGKMVNGLHRRKRGSADSAMAQVNAVVELGELFPAELFDEGFVHGILHSLPPIAFDV